VLCIIVVGKIRTGDPRCTGIAGMKYPSHHICQGKGSMCDVCYPSERFEPHISTAERARSQLLQSNPFQRSVHVLGNRSSEKEFPQGGKKFPHHMSLYCSLMSSASKFAPAVAHYAGIIPLFGVWCVTSQGQEPGMKRCSGV
jgi:hypothetical protein